MLSNRATIWSNLPQWHGPQNLYHENKNPEGVVSFGNSENFLMHKDLTNFINTNASFGESCLAYGEGFTGTVRLRNAMASHLNAYFNPVKLFDAEQITFAAGVTALSEICALVICDAGANESILLGMPMYGGFSKDLALRTGVKLEYANLGDLDQFETGAVAAYEAAYNDAVARGVKINAFFICNPHNPLGRCYSRGALKTLLQFCAAKGIHLISDEIFALSAYNRPDRQAESFTSIWSIDLDGIIDPAQVHVLYGMSKNYGACGMRLGCLISQNIEFTRAVRTSCHFCPPSQFSMEIATKLLENKKFLCEFLDKSREVLLQSRLLAEKLLDQENISYYKHGNAGMFVWLDLRRHLPIGDTKGDDWAAEKLLAARFKQEGVLMSCGGQYAAPNAGYFRLIHSVPESHLRKGVERIAMTLKCLA